MLRSCERRRLFPIEHCVSSQTCSVGVIPRETVIAPTGT